MYTREHILNLLECIAKEFDYEWNGDSDTHEESQIYKEIAGTIRDYKYDYE